MARKSTIISPKKTEHKVDMTTEFEKKQRRDTIKNAIDAFNNSNTYK